MKLFTHYNRVNLLTTIIVLFITGAIYYGAISYILNHQVDKDIRTEEAETLDYIKEHNTLPEAIDSKYLTVTYLQVNQPVERRFSNADFYNKKEGEKESGRALITSAVVNGRIYQVTISESKVETEDLIRIVFGITIGVILFLLLVLFITNRFILNRIWKPFYGTLHQLRAFSLNDGNDVSAQPSKIDEFNELNQAVEHMSARVKRDYKDLKAFTENASHELLTPIAVINSKMDSLIQTGEYNEQQSKLLDDVYDAVSRLTRLNQSLLLLVKIENKLVTDNEIIHLKPLIEEKISEFKELFHDKQLVFTCEMTDKQVTTSRYLIEILLNNLLSNAMRHNYQNGEINVLLTNTKLMIQNTGTENALPQNEIYKRFNKSASSEGTGLGLTICKQICDNYGYQLNYSYDTLYHSFTILFNQQ
ncbi:MAG: HAMP domain-containing sensor histidine kinase [Mucilaginibacter sp.]|uniref:sensor histidine kinase n=1 Tax=Mucilaginibacter sp. TaxID=1882438 RepID=UPI00326795D7